MSTTDWKKVWDLFEKAIALPPEARRGLLEEIGGGDPDLRRSVEKMLAADARGSTLLDEGVAPREPVAGGEPRAGSSVGESEGVADGASIGGYRLIRRIGQGGMSTVFLAVREDEFQRRVVVKVIRPGLENEATIRGLRLERSILASLNHPNIARLYDGGATNEGMPYFVMEYVEGVAIDAYCESNRLSIDQRLTLFRKVCEAVGFAHQNLVVHRDLKPANILVGADGEPKLLDFGIAKLLNPELSAEGLEPTATWHRALTPSYASPEQIRGDLITTASDVYSLGVVFYRLLTGRPPHDFTDRSPSEIERLVTTGEPLKPSLAVGRAPSSGDPEGSSDRRPGDRLPRSPERVRRALAGDLDAIVLKALRSAPPDRYRSVEQLLADLDRYRDGLPVAARQGTWRYRTGKLVRRHRTAVAAGISIALMLVAFALSMLWQSDRVARERDQARLENEKKEQVLALILDIFALSNPYVLPGAELTVREALERSLPVLESRLGEQPAVRAELLHTAGSILAVIGRHDTARQELEEALALRRELHGRSHADVIETMSELAGARADLGELDAAEEMAREAVEIARRLYGPTAPEVFAPLTTLVSVLCYRSEFGAAEEPAREALALARILPGSEAKESMAQESLALIRSSQGDYREAASLYRKAVAFRRARYGESHPSQINTLNNLGLALRRQEELEAAEDTYNEVLDLQRLNYGDEFKDPILMINLASVRLAQADHSGAEELFRETIDVVGGPGSDHWLLVPAELGIAQSRLGRGAAAEAEAGLRRHLPRWQANLGEKHWRIAQATSILGACLSAQGRHVQAEPLLIDSYRRLSEVGKHRHRSDAYERLRDHFKRVDRPDDLAAIPPPDNSA